MKKTTITIPSHLIFQTSIDFIIEINKLDTNDLFEFDFQHFKYIDPFSLLYVSSEIQRFTDKHSLSEFQATNYKHCTYPAHMGFFQSFGVEFGKNPGEAIGSSTYIPISIHDTKEILRSANESMMHPAEFMELKSHEIAKILLRSLESKEIDVLTYCIREIFRNVIEHSKSEQFGFCAQYRPTIGIVSFSIVDRGIGLHNSLNDNPTLEISSDLSAIYHALNPGVSGKVYKGQKNKPKGEWANSGYGLYMTSQICKKGGGFFIASGNTGLYMSENKVKILETPFKGTALNLAIQTSRISSLKKMLAEIDQKNEFISPPSQSSLGLMLTYK